MLIIGSLGVFLSYQFFFDKLNTQSWQLAKTATEFSYWMDIEQNYEQDYANDLKTSTDFNNIKLADIINQRYLPYGMGRSPTFTNSSSDQVSEFLCSPLPGINTQNAVLTLNGENQTCPAVSSSAAAHCALSSTDKIYYSCANNKDATVSQAQYYVNANYVSIGNNPSQNIGLGLLLPTPGSAASVVNLGATGTRGLLPNGSAAQYLMSTLPGAAFNVYTTQSPPVDVIGVASYLSSAAVTKKLQNNRYSKIIDMGLVQAVDLTKVGSDTPCYGWDASGKKTGVGSSYIVGTEPPDGTSFPPTCIRIDTSQYTYCKQIDVLYTMYRNFIDNVPSENAPSQFYSYVNSYVQTDSSNNNIRNVFLSQSLQNVTGTTVNSPVSGQYTSNGGGETTQNKQRDTWLAYIVRCTQDNV
jgi:hypothetical protein